MDLLEDLNLYLPKYLSADNLVELKKQLRAWGEGHDPGEFFTTKLKKEPFLFQGDGTNALIGNFPDPKIQEGKVLLLSNTCDMDPANIRLNPSRIMYAPILNLDKYIESLTKKEISDEKIHNHIQDLKSQTISQIFYLPTYHLWGHDSIVLFDRAISIHLSSDHVRNMVDARHFTLSNFGFYLLVLKLSYHFSRIQEKVDRD